MAKINYDGGAKVNNQQSQLANNLKSRAEDWNQVATVVNANDDETIAIEARVTQNETDIFTNTTALQAANLKTAYESNADTNAFTDAEKTKLGGIEASAKDDQTGDEIKALYELEANAFTDALYAIVSLISSAGSGQIITTAERNKLASILSGPTEITVSTNIPLSNPWFGASGLGSGSDYGTLTTPATETTYTMTGAVEEGFFEIWITASSVPTFSGYTTEDLGYNSVFVADGTTKNRVYGRYKNGVVELTVDKTVATPPSSSVITDIASLGLWWSKEDWDGSGNTTLSDGGNVSTVEDMHTTNIDGSTAEPPSFRASDGALVFDKAATEYMANTSTGVSAQPVTIVTVFTPQTGIINGDCIWSNDDTGAGPLLSWRLDTDTFVRCSAGLWSGNVPATIGTQLMITVVLDGSNSAIYKDGNATPVVTGNFGSNGMGNKIIWGAGTDATTPALPAAIDGFELLVFDSALTTQELADVHGYFITEYGF